MNRMKLTSLGQAPACASTRCRSASCFFSPPCRSSIEGTMRGPSMSIGSSDPRRSNATHQEATNVDRAHVRSSLRPVSRIHAALSFQSITETSNATLRADSIDRSHTRSSSSLTVHNRSTRPFRHVLHFKYTCTDCRLSNRK